MANTYKIIGIVLMVIGFFIAPYSYLVLDSMPITAVGFSTLILGFTSLVLANSRPVISAEAFQIFVKTGVENITAIIKELDLKNKAVYITRNMSNGSSKALIPLHDKNDVEKIKKLLPAQIMLRYMPGKDNMAIAVTTPGNISLDMLSGKPGSTPDEIKTAIKYILNRVMGIADVIRVNQIDSHIVVEINGPNIINERDLYYQCLGSPIASIAAAVCSESLNKPVRIYEEINYRTKSKIVMEILS
ncbi:MAG: hypothetical protein ACOWWR_19325 [Eubacteriales bacterium]